MTQSLAPPEPNKLQREVVESPGFWFVQTPLCVGAGLLSKRVRSRDRGLWRTPNGRLWLGGAAFAFAVMMPFDVWYYRRAAAAVADRDGWEMRQKRLGRPVPAPVGVRGADGTWRAGEPAEEEETGTGLAAGARGAGVRRDGWAMGRGSRVVAMGPVVARRNSRILGRFRSPRRAVRHGGARRVKLRSAKL
ncbi:uncharacterized protein PG998_008745 [Apiospora kogelbergensis]|uniref:uncharacterized protein n=1 Tax=Apiospora kogelbergensis TaxID=1337665 RepID=UPI003130D5A3